MAGRRSRYLGARRFDPPVFPGLLPRSIVTPVGVLEHRVTEGDRLDLLARHYYGDDRLWWRIADANPEAVEAGELVAVEGRVILVPAAPGRDGR